MYLVGGFVSLIQHFSKNIFILDEHRSILVPKQNMKGARCDHALHYHNDKIYAIGGMASNGEELESLRTCEAYSISDDQWS
jgi:N-acetylneuraminic acid mutarotase